MDAGQETATEAIAGSVFKLQRNVGIAENEPAGESSTTIDIKLAILMKLKAVANTLDFGELLHQYREAVILPPMWSRSQRMSFGKFWRDLTSSEQGVIQAQ